jgi:hypothetical protein
MSGIVCNMTDLLQDLVTETTTLSKLNRIKIIHCFESNKGVRKKIEQLGPSKIENIEYDVERFHTFPDYDYRFEVLEQIFEIQYTPELEK